MMNKFWRFFGLTTIGNQNKILHERYELGFTHGLECHKHKIHNNFTDEELLSLHSGEFIHTIANWINDGVISIKHMDKTRAAILMEISQALRVQVISDPDSPTLLEYGIRISHFTRAQLCEIACILINTQENISHIAAKVSIVN